MSIQSDLHNTIDYAFGGASEAVTDDTALVSAIFDMQDYASLEFITTIGTLADADATFTTLIEHSDDSGLSGAVAVPDDQLLGTEADASFAFGDDDSSTSIGYVGDKRYVRYTNTPANNTGAATYMVTTAATPLHRGTVN